MAQVGDIEAKKFILRLEKKDSWYLSKLEAFCLDFYIRFSSNLVCLFSTNKLRSIKSLNQD